ncbi:uncharacterized protein LOC118477201, partial [Aplysia californica]|uniref:Uncharacterized protein LOC118477201 n=1 Tax=Aplysia californica TaxID=6500 RepID=A0ABM1W2I2_APLCA
MQHLKDEEVEIWVMNQLSEVDENIADCLNMPKTSDTDLTLEDTVSFSKEELLQENHYLHKKAQHAMRFALVLGALALIFLGALVAILINLSINDDSLDSDVSKPSPLVNP